MDLYCVRAAEIRALSRCQRLPSTLQPKVSYQLVSNLYGSQKQREPAMIKE